MLKGRLAFRQIIEEGATANSCAIEAVGLISAGSLIVLLCHALIEDILPQRTQGFLACQ
jgi:hypothetical protein